MGYDAAICKLQVRMCFENRFIVLKTYDSVYSKLEFGLQILILLNMGIICAFAGTNKKATCSMAFKRLPS